MGSPELWLNLCQLEKWQFSPGEEKHLSVAFLNNQVGQAVCTVEIGLLAAIVDIFIISWGGGGGTVIDKGPYLETDRLAETV